MEVASEELGLLAVPHLKYNANNETRIRAGVFFPYSKLEKDFVLPSLERSERS